LNVYVLRAIEVIALSVVMFFSTMLTSREMTKRKFKYPRWLPYAVSEGGVVLLFLLGGFSVWTFRGCALLLILLFASIQDHSTHEADDVLSVMILLLAITTVTEETVLYQLLVAGIVFIAQLLVGLFAKKTGIGGADIKLSTASVFLLGFYRGIIGFMLGLLIAIVAEIIRNRKNKQPSTEPFPLIPYLSVGLIIGYLI